MPLSRPVRRSPLPGLILFLCGVVAGAAGLYFGFRDRLPWGGERPSRQAAEPPMADDAPRATSRSSRAAERSRRSADRAADRADRDRPPRRAASEPGPRPRLASDLEPAAGADGVRVALVIDDLGRSVE